MDRRGKRAAAAAEVKAAPAANTRASSKSPSRRSSRNRSPARNASPGRTKPSATQRPKRSGRNKITDNDTASETDDSKSDILPKMSVKLVNLNEADLKGTQKSALKGRKTPTSKGKVSINDGDEEVASLTAKYISDKLASGNNLTPSESDKRSYSRSMSRSLVEDEEWTHSDTSEKNDDPLYANRITRSRSKTHGNNLLRRQQSLNNDAAAEFGGSIGALLLIILLPVLCFFTQYVCSRPECNVKSVRWEKLKLLSTFFSLESGYLFLGYSWLVCLLSAIPYLGVRRSLPQAAAGAEQPPTFYFNGLATAIAIVSGLATAEFYFKLPVQTLIYKNYQQLALVGIIYSLIISVWCFLRSAYFPVTTWNPYAKSGRLISDLFIGREINPRWLQVIDIKLVHRRIALISTLIFNLIFLSRNIKYVAAPVVEAPLTYTEIVAQHLQNLRLDPVAATVSLLVIVYVLDALIFEHHLISSFELHAEGVGAQLLLQYATFPVWTSLISKFALQHKISGVPNWLLAVLAVLYIGGILLKRLSNELKYHYRVNPTSSRSAKLETLPTFQGKRLLVSRYWRFLRHPNFVGEIISVVSLLPLLYFRFAWSPLIAALFTVALLVHRARRIDTRMAQHYNSAWTRYKQQVKYSLIPRIY